MSKLLGAEKSNGKLLNITLQIHPSEVPIYESLIKSDYADMKCPHCNGDFHINPDTMCLIIDSPLYPSMLGFETATPVFRCNMCEKKISMNLVDITPFYSEVVLLNSLRNRYNKKKKEHMVNEE